MSKISTTSPSTTKQSSVEGFDLIGTENMIKRGKASNSIPVYPQSKNSSDISPYDGGSVFTSF
jgi:hypothetical protein